MSKLIIVYPVVRQKPSGGPAGRRFFVVDLFGGVKSRLESVFQGPIGDKRYGIGDKRYGSGDKRYGRMKNLFHIMFFGQERLIDNFSSSDRTNC